MSSPAAWIKASRLPSQSYIALPLLFGQALAYSWTGQFRWDIFLMVQIWGICDQLYIVYANDWADRETDTYNQTVTLFSGGSRVLVEGLLSPGQIGRAAVVMAALAMVLSVVLSLIIKSGFIVFLSAFAVSLLWAYSFSPFKLSYRGGGELLQMLGMAVVLPLFGWYAQAGTLAGFPFWIFVPLLLINLASAITTALPDEPSDRVSKKRTVPVLAGGLWGKRIVMLLNLLGGMLFMWIWHVQVGHSPGSIAAGMVVFAATACCLCLSGGAYPGSVKMFWFVFSGLFANLGWLIGLQVLLLW